MIPEGYAVPKAQESGFDEQGRRWMIGRAMLECERCKAVTYDPDGHDDWHVSAGC